MTARPPNIVIVMADQMAPAFLPIYGHALTRAPHMQALARDGVVFDSAYCASPLCSPSRASFMAGLASFAHAGLRQRRGIRRRHSRPSPIVSGSAATGPSSSGKMHFCGPDQLHGFEERLTTDIYPADYGWTPDWDQPDERPSWYHNMSSVAQAGVCVRTNQLDFDDEVAFASERAIFDIARSERAAAVPAGRVLHPPSRSVRGAAALLGPLSRRGHRPARRRVGNAARSALAPPAPCLRHGRRAGDGGAGPQPRGAPISGRSPMSTTISAV